MHQSLILCCLLLGMFACASQKKSVSNTGADMGKASGDTRTKPVVMLDNDAYLLAEISADKTYGYEPSNPVKVGNDGGGPQNERRFLNGLRGPNGETVSYSRAGSCCPFKTENGMMGMGMLDNYRVTWQGASDTVSIYINMYDEGNLFVPVGLTARKKE